MSKLHSLLTKTESTILHSWTSKNSEYFTGIMLEAGEVFSICDGVIVQLVNDSSNTTVITVQHDRNTYLRYCHLDSKSVASLGLRPGVIVREGHKLGEGYSNKFTFEVCTRTQSMWPVRIGNITVYKCDPTPYTDVNYYKNDSLIDCLNLPTTMLAEFGNYGEGNNHE